MHCWGKTAQCAHRGLKNLFFCLDDDEDNLCTVVISLMQKGRRELRDEGLDMLTIGKNRRHLEVFVSPVSLVFHTSVTVKLISKMLFRTNTSVL